MHPPPSDNYRLIKNQINGTDIRKPKSVHPSRRKSSFHSAMVAPKSEPLRRKVMHGGNFELYASREALCASTMDLRLPPRFEAPPPPPLSRDEETRMKKNQVHASRNSLYKEGSNGNQEYSEYGELRAIVRRIEEQKLNHLSRNNTFVSRNQSFSTGKSPHLNRKRMYFDYVPSSVMRSNSHHGGQGPPRPNNLGVPSQSTQTLPHPGSLTMNNSNLSPRHPHHHNNPLIRHPDHFSPDRSSGSSHFPGVSPDSSGTLLNSRLDDSNTASNSPSSSMDNRKGRRNSHKASTQSSSLLIKRSEDAPVTLKGWLYKQGSDGLMLWKKRWFVLSEYCLFYYRSPEEDKVSGSILLPSYKISPVAKEDAVFRRFCFKAEHQNMRTYYFATDTKEAMIQWMNALSLASIMQTPSTGSSSANTTTTPTSPNVTMNGNHLAQSRSSVAVMNNLRTPVTHHQYPTQVHQMYSPNGNAYQYQGESSPASPTSPEGLENGRQPLYANAPPKPRRLTNTREDSPDRFEDEELSPAYHQQMYSRQNPGKVPLRSHTPGERMMYPQAQHYPYQQATHVQNLQQQQRHTQTPGEPIYNGNNINHEVASHNRQGGPTIRHRLPQERRTPEAYGRSHFNMMNQNMSQNYEDVFRNRNNPGYPPPQGRNYPPPPVPQQQSQLPPLPQQHPMFQGYQYPQHQVPHQPCHPQQAQPVTPQYHPPEPPRQRTPRETQRPSSQPQQKVPRPHSADFLELDRNVVAVPTQSSGANNPTNPNQYQSQTQTPHHYMGNHVRRKQNPQPPRPKSSVDPRMFDSSWSTEHYAEQMRNHAPAYAMGTPQQTPRSQSRASIHSKSHLMQDNHVQSQPRTPQTRLYPPQTSQTSDSQVDSSEEVSRYFPTPSPRKPVQVSTTYQNLPDNSTIVTRQYPQYQARLETVTPNRLSEQYQGNNGSDSGTGEFRRSASARLHRNKKNYPEMLNNSDLGPEDSKKKEQREESMKRLLEWKQRMLQSPLTRKSSRNASRTQTPTNSNSPVPSLGHDTQFRQKVLDELEKQSGKSSTPGNSSSNTTGERRLSRKGSGASRSSRSRSSPRIANRPNTSSSDEDKHQTLESSRQSRKKVRPQSEKRSRNPSRESRRSSSQVGSATDQPEYINISCLEPALSPERGQDLQVRETIVKAEWRKRAIGPDDWYSDDFNFDNAKNSFSEDPLLSGQYSHLLDLKYHNQTAGAFVKETNNVVQENLPPLRSKPRRTLKDQGRSVTWHADKFKDFQIMGKQNKQDVLLTIEGDGNLTGSLQRPNKDVEQVDKIHWSPVQAFEEIKRMKEAPPTNLVKDRLQKFQSEERLQRNTANERKISAKSSVSGSAFSLEDINAALEDDDNVFESAQKTPQPSTEEPSKGSSIDIKAVEISETKALIERQRKRREKFFETVLSDSKDDVTTDDDLDVTTEPVKPRERKRSVRELLSDFEKKSKEIHDQEIQEGENDDLSGSRRRVFSDTETMMFETSSDDVTSEDANKPVDKKPSKPDVFTPEVPPRTPKGPKPRALRQENQYLPMSPPTIPVELMQAEGQYLPMTPSKTKVTTSTQSRSSITSSSASRGSTQSILTPTEMLLQAHNRTPSQSLVIDHLQKELSSNIPFQEGTYVHMLDDHESMKVPSRDQLPKRPILAPPNFQEPKFASKPKESPRYIEIDDPEEEEKNNQVMVVTDMSHYEYLYKARSATPLHYEAVYQEISDDDSPKGMKTTKGLPQSPSKSEPKAPVPRLPDIIGNTPAHRGHSSSDADDEGGAHLSHSRAKSNVNISDSFKPASFFLNPPKRSLSQDIRTDHSQPERRTSSGSLSARELPMTPIERRKSAEDLHRTLEGSMRSSISSLDSAGKRKTTLENIEEERRGTIRGRREAVTVLPPQPEVGYQNEEGDQLEHSSLPLVTQYPPHQSDQKTRAGSVMAEPNHSLSPRSSKVPYYVSDLNESQATIDRARAIDELHLSMELLDAQTNEHLARKSNDDMLHRIRRSAAATPVHDLGYPGGPVARSQSLEGLLGDSPGTPRDSVQVQMQATPTLSSANLPPRGREAPPPPPNVPPLDLRSAPPKPQPWTKEASNDSVEEEDDPVWRESLRRASAKHRARSTDPRNQNVGHLVRQGPHDPSFYWDERDQRFYKIKDPQVAPPNPQTADPSFLDQSLPVPIDSRAQGSGRPLPSEPLNSSVSIENPDSGIYENADFFPDSSTTFLSWTSAQNEVCLTTESQIKAQYVEANINNNTPLRVRQQTGPPPGRRRTSSASRKDSDTLKQKVRGNLLDITAQDLLGKSHEELVLMLIHLRRQGAALKEAIDSTKAEMQSVAHHPNDTDENQKLHQDLICHIRELEDQHARAHPVITLVDNMVKLGSLYRGPADAPLSHRIRNLPTSSSSSSGVSSSYDSKSQRKTPFDDDKVKMAEQEKAVVQETLESSLEQTKQTIPNGSEEFDAFNKEQEMLENELRRVHGQLQTSQKKLDENSSEHSRWEHDILFLRQTLQQSVTRNMQYGISQSAETLAIEGELAQVQQRASELHRERQSLMTDIQKLSSRQDYLAHEYRSNSSAADKNVANKSKPVESEPKNYENVHTATPKLTPEKESSEMMELTLGDISEADDRVKKFYGIIPKDNKAAEIKTVRMVKRDSKERSVIKSSRSYVDENGRLIEVEMDDGETPMTTPPMLPRGNYGPNMHDFLQTSTNGNETPKKRGEIFSSGSLPRNYESSSSAESSGNFTNSPAGKALISQVNGTSASTTAVNGGLYSKPNFKLGEYNRKKSKDSSERPASGLSAHERLFGSSRESSMSPPMSPLKNSVLTGSSDSGVSPIMSPIFKSATAKQIAEEVGKHGPPGGTKYRRKSKKRSHTITSGNPAIMEALNNHDAKQSTNRSRDDMDMERILRPRTNAPDVIKSALDKKDMKINSTTIDNLFGVPEKIVIPERYIPDTDMDNITQEERQVRLKKADSIRRMLADTGAAPVLGGLTPKQKENLEDEKKEREHILALNQVLARQVMEKSRIVAGRKLSP